MNSDDISTTLDIMGYYYYTVLGIGQTSEQSTDLLNTIEYPAFVEYVIFS